ncbi:MAG: DUF72 domain-containing protein [Actinobacteria bacterium]|nr:MAG: DUF72 domain-containing protein [Actinomycetota bacterium]
MRRALVGTSGWSYPTWRPAFYPAGARTDELLGLYAGRLPAVELNATGYRLPAAEQFRRWAEQVPTGFRFAVKAPRLVLRSPAVVAERVRELGDRLGCVRLVVESARDDALLERLLSGFAGTRLALDLRDGSWDGVETLLGDDAVRVGDMDAQAGWRYVRFRDPPYDRQALEAFANRLRPLVESGVDVFGFFRHEDEPTAPKAALELLALLR